MRIAID